MVGSTCTAEGDCAMLQWSESEPTISKSFFSSSSRPSCLCNNHQHARNPTRRRSAELHMWPRFCSLLCRCGQFSGREPASLTRSPMANQRGQGASGSLATADWAGRGFESSASSRPRERKRSISRLGWNDVSGLLLARRVFFSCMQLSGVSTSASSSHVSQSAIGRPPNLVFDILHVDEPEGERSLPDAMSSHNFCCPRQLDSANGLSCPTHHLPISDKLAWLARLLTITGFDGSVTRI